MIDKWVSKTHLASPDIAHIDPKFSIALVTLLTAVSEPFTQLPALELDLTRRW
jgi:hypothetical protein